MSTDEPFESGRRTCPFCGCQEVTLEEIEMTVFGLKNRVETVWYCQHCGANAPEKTWKEDQKNAD